MLVPNVMDTLCLAAKAWSDVCYLDEITGRARERLSTQDKQAVNMRAMQYAQQVRTSAAGTALALSSELVYTGQGSSTC